jgi:phosphatidylinositol 4-kinase
MNFPTAHIDSTVDSLVPALLDILRDVPFIDFERSLSWEGISIGLPSTFLHVKPVITEWALPDQLVYSTVSALLRLSNSHPQYRDSASASVNSFILLAAEKILSEARQCISFRSEIVSLMTDTIYQPSTF